jgi:hypothetical protein
MAINLANNNSLANITALPSSISGGAMTLISEQTASSSATIDFTSGIDSTYDSYVFKFINIHPATDNVRFQYNGSTDGGSNYNVTKTSTAFYAYHNESDSDTTLAYSAGGDLAQGTGFQDIVLSMGNGADENASGEIILYNPSSTTFVKHWISRTASYSYQDYAYDWYTAGYMNTTSAVNAIQFKMTSGNIDSGVIKLYGIS